MSSQNPSDQVPDYGQYVPPAGQAGAPDQSGGAWQHQPQGHQQGYPQDPYQQPGYQQPGYQPAAAQPLSPADTKTWAGLSHLLGGILGFLAPLAIWLLFRQRSHVVDAEAKRALNFQILVFIVLVGANLVLPGFIEGLVIFGVWVTSLVFGIVNFQAFNNGRPTSYPVDVKIVK
ncbi:DUF4870 domain-containing protein [Oerskovia turbata]